MIHFYCLECGRKFQVADEFAGRTTRCVACKSPLQVPQPERTETSAPIARLVVADGGASADGERVGALASATIAYDPSAAASGTDTLGTDRPVADVIARDGQERGRYLIDREIARGGMGAVLRGIDRDIRREVAVKVMLDGRDPRKQARFVEEAQITGQLEHPNIVPVHELGLDEQRRPFFTMKMVKGRSLEEILKRQGEPGASATGEQFTLGRLLSILVNVCHALGYAHARRVIHRDLKPANVMVGDFGEVYVMDWGLAKVLEEAPPAAAPVIVPTPIAARPLRPPAPEPSATTSLSGGSRVSTSRQEEADLTQDGSILGTPAYMAPEQALGRIGAIDERSDVYALGGLLYAMLTLQPPVEKGGGQAALLLRVAQGEIKKPEERAPGRAIPTELSAIAMKALAKEPQDRYPSAAAFRQDVELYLEGRSVSAKQDTFREQAWKLVKRNKGASIATAAALVVLFAVAGVFLKANYDARVIAEDNHAAFLEEAERRRGAIPSFLTAAQLLIDRLDFKGARAQVGLILEIDPEHLQARLVRAQLALVAQKFDQARDDLSAYRKARPGDPQARDLLAFLPRAQVNDEATQLLLAEIFSKHHEHALATGAVQSLGENTLAARQKALELYRARIDKIWPGRGKSLGLHKGGVFHLNLSGGNNDITDLSPLRGMPLTGLTLHSCQQIRDVSGLRGLPLTALTLMYVPVTDLSPLKGMPLETMTLWGTNVEDLSPLKEMKLKILYLDMSKITDVSPLKDLPLAQFSIVRTWGFSDPSPLQGLPLTDLNLNSTRVRDLSPFKGMPLRTLRISGTWVTDLTPIKELPLTTLEFSNTNVSDLSPLAGMQLESLKCHETRVADLSPLKDMPLAILHCEKTPISDLSPLKDMNLRALSFSPGNITKGIEAIRGMKSLTLIGDAYNTLVPAAEFWKRYDAGEFQK